MEEKSYVFLFTFLSLPLIFTLVAACISHFLTAAIKFSCFSFFSFLVFLSLALAISLLSTSVWTLKSSRKKEPALLLLVFSSLKVRVAMRFTAETCGCLKCKISLRLTWRGKRTSVQTIFSEPKFLEYIDNQMFLPIVLRYAQRARTNV